MRSTVSAFDPVTPDFLEDHDPDTTDALRPARVLASLIVTLNPNAIATIDDRNNDWADERIGATYDDACLRAMGAAHAH